MKLSLSFVTSDLYNINYEYYSFPYWSNVSLPLNFKVTLTHNIKQKFPKNTSQTNMQKQIYNLVCNYYKTQYELGYYITLTRRLKDALIKDFDFLSNFYIKKPIFKFNIDFNNDVFEILEGKDLMKYIIMDLYNKYHEERYTDPDFFIQEKLTQYRKKQPPLLKGEKKYTENDIYDIMFWYVGLFKTIYNINYPLFKINLNYKFPFTSYFTNEEIILKLLSTSSTYTSNYRISRYYV